MTETAVKDDFPADAAIKCDVCLFGIHDLCSLPQDSGCPTFRPEHMAPAGLNLCQR